MTPSQERRPLAKISVAPAEPARVESRDERIAFRVAGKERSEIEAAALKEFGPGGLSRYARDCLFIGHSMKQAQARLKATSV